MLFFPSYSAILAALSSITVVNCQLRYQIGRKLERERQET